MKAVNKLVVLISLGAILPLASFAKTSNASYLETSLKGPGVPVPVAVVSPSHVGSDYIGTTIELAFTVDTKGSPTNLTVLTSPDGEIARVMMDAVKQWRFTPAQKNGVAVATKVVLPVRISESGSFATN
jgi:protein TonB